MLIMDLQKNVSSIIHTAIQVIRENRLTKVQGRVSISAAIIATCLYYLYRRVSIPPKALQHIPHVNYIQMMGAYLTGEPLQSITKRIVNPVINSEGLYLRPTRGFWNVCVANPQIAKILYNKGEMINSCHSPNAEAIVVDLFPKIDLTAANKGTYSGKFSVRSNNLFFSTGDEWKRQRKIANPAFHKAMPISIFGSYTERLFNVLPVSKIDDEVVINMSNYVERYTMDVIGNAGFDFSFNSLENPQDEYVSRYGKVVRAMSDPLFYFFPKFDCQYLWMFPKRQELHKELDLFLDLVKVIIIKKRETMEAQMSSKELTFADEENRGGSSSKKEKDILELLISSAYDEENGDMDIANNDMLLSNMCVLFTAGHETTTAAILFLMYELALHQDLQQKARDEAIKILGDDGTNILPTVEAIAKMDYLTMLIKETLRLHPPAPVSAPRIAMDDCHLGETFIPKGSTIVLDVISIHRNPEFWDNPDQFNPDRFLPDGEVETKTTGSGTSFVPFGGGSRHCIGRKFSMNEQLVMMSMFLKKYTWTLPPDSIHKNGLVTKGIFLLSPLNMHLIIKSRY